MKKGSIKIVLLVLVLNMMIFTGCSKKEENLVTILTSAEDYRIEYMRKRLKEEFPEYEIIIEYKDTGSHAAKIAAEGKEIGLQSHRWRTCRLYHCAFLPLHAGVFL